MAEVCPTCGSAFKAMRGEFYTGSGYADCFDPWHKVEASPEKLITDVLILNPDAFVKILYARPPRSAHQGPWRKHKRLTMNEHCLYGNHSICRKKVGHRNCKCICHEQVTI